MIGPPFTPTKLVLLGVLALLLWTFAAFQMRRRWCDLRERRQFAEAGGLRARQRLDRRRIATRTFAVFAIACGIALAYLDVAASPQTRSRFRAIAAQTTTLMKWALILLVALIVLGFLLLWIARDRTLPAVARLALAGKHREAEDLLRSVICDKGETETRLTALGLLLMEQNRLDEALASFEAARRLARRPATAMNNCAMALKKLGRLEEARQLFDQALRLEPNHFIALANSCLLLAEMGHETEAFDRLDRAEDIYQRYDPSQVKAWKPLLEECRHALPRAQGFPVAPVNSPTPTQPANSNLESPPG